MSAGELIHVTTVIYLVLTAAIFALFGLIQKWVENL
ncbi:potassium-transporting ATPase [Mycolicibacterium parafortuitum]|nr:potassium-transporting ATPase [Mycolicibacterium parafortuitum]PQD99357.1 potassium-transporting ATPase [Mycobacterium sp. EPG1]